jgi:hypothetical protein
MVGSAELLILLVFSLIYLAIPLVTLVIVIRMSQRLSNIEQLIKSRQESN